MYRHIFRPLLFFLPPETAHHLVVFFLKIVSFVPGKLWLIKKIYSVNVPALTRNLFGLTFPNPVGLAAGFDKDAKCFDELGAFGFGFIEVGTVTPKPQPGNSKPRLFRLAKDKALINRMGFNNQGADAMRERLEKRKNFSILIAANIGKNKTTPNENAVSDYEYCFEKLFDVVDFFVVNVSSPNTPGLRELQEKEPLKKILLRLMELREARSQKPEARSQKPEARSQKPEAKGRKPILLKISPNLTFTQLDEIIEVIRETKIDGVVATNTTLSRENLQTPNSKLQTIGNGGLSGKPLNQRSTEVIKYISNKTNRTLPIIASGGIHSAEDALEKIEAGASLVEIYTGFIYEGPSLIKKINRAILKMPCLPQSTSGT